MFITHSFAHMETLDRARYWLTRLGFAPSHIEVHTEGVPRILLRGGLPEVAEAELLFAALESSDPDRAPGFWSSAHSPHAGLVPRAHLERVDAHPRAAVGWHPPDSDLRADPDVRALFDVMDH